MAYNFPWDEDAPDGATTKANTIDTIIQDLKKSIKERMAGLLHADTGWEDDTADPKRLKYSAIKDPPSSTSTRIALLRRTSSAVQRASNMMLGFNVAPAFDSIAQDIGSMTVTGTRITVDTAGFYLIDSSISGIAGRVRRTTGDWRIKGNFCVGKNGVCLDLAPYFDLLYATRSPVGIYTPTIADGLLDYLYDDSDGTYDRRASTPLSISGSVVQLDRNDYLESGFNVISWNPQATPQISYNEQGFFRVRKIVGAIP